jgi:hypothetical protein
MRRKKVLDKNIDDLTGLAGWMYTDLLLALMVIFLATISFVPQIYGSVTSENTSVNNSVPTYKYSQYYEKPLVKIYNKVDINLIKKDIVDFLTQEKLPTTSFVGSIQIVGGYNKDTEKATLAVERALSFSNELDKQDPKLLENASTILSSASTLGANQVTLRITFIADINVRN